MRAWNAPGIPVLPVTGPPVVLHDTATGGTVETSPEGGTARLYVCGITPYDATHLGHAATYLAFDLVNRMWRDAGHAVHYVQNVTDIDDPLEERADRDHEDWIVLGMRETALFREDMTALRVLPPENYVGAVESIPAIVAHSMCQPGRPAVPRGPGQDGSPGRCPRHSIGSSGCRLPGRSGSPPRSAKNRSIVASS